MGNDQPTVFTSSLETYCKHLLGRNVSAYTITAYHTDLKQFLSWMLSQDGTVTGPKDITRAHIIDYLSHLSGQGRSGVTGKDVSPTLLEAPTEKLALRRHEVIDAGAGDEKPLEIARDWGSTSGNASEPSCMRSNLQPIYQW